jgi:hypothetical protein
MPKKPRQSHVPKQQVARRKVRRPNVQSSAVMAPAYVEEPFVDSGEGEQVIESSTPVAPRPSRRLELVRQSRESVPLRSLPGQLPTYDRAYLVSELRTISIVTASLLALIIVLAIVLR